MDAQAALAVYARAWQVSDQAYASPSKDWEGTIRESIADPYALLVIKSIQRLSENHLHTAGANKIEATVMAVQGSGDGTKVSIEACVDSSDTDLLDQNGNSAQ